LFYIPSNYTSHDYQIHIPLSNNNPAAPGAVEGGRNDGKVYIKHSDPE
jgi:hypothetical protein